MQTTYRVPGLTICCVLVCSMVHHGELSAAPKPRETWHAIVDGELRYGSQHLVVSQADNGHFRYQLETRTLIDLFGSQKQEVTSREELVVTHDYKIVSLHVERGGPSGTTQVDTTIKDGTLHLQFKRENLTWTDRIQMSEDSIVGTCLHDYLREQTAHANGTVGIIDTENWETRRAHFTLDPSSTGNHPIWTIRFDQYPGRTTISFGADGIVDRQDNFLPAVSLILCTQKQAGELRYRVLTGRELLMFPIGKPIGHPDRLKELRVKLSWSTVPIDQLRLQDLRQQIDASDVIGQNREVVLRLTNREPTDHSLPYPMNVGEWSKTLEFSQALASTRYIKPLDESIRKRSREWIGDAKDSLQAVRNLSRGVSTFLEGGSMIAETLSGPEVLLTKQGKCSEYAILFASLARSAGIPTRIALGERLSNDHWIGHMWNEAYVGEWVPVDSTVNEVGGFMPLIKLIDSDTVSGTQPMRFALTESLKIEVMDFEQIKSELAESWTTGIQGRNYTNVNYDCRITAPNETWKVVDLSKGGTTPTIRFNVPDDAVLIHFVAFPVPHAISLDVLLNARKARFAISYPGFKLLEQQEFELGDAGGQTLFFQRDAGQRKDGKPRVAKTSEFIWTEGASGYIVNMIAPAEKHDQYLAEFMQLMKSFRYLSKLPE